MSSNNDNAMARFLFAILQQKCLKDIDWNKVAHNPILAQEITNGHAARMRYSRFRAAMLGLEPQRRNRANPSSKSRVSKKKNDDAVRPKKEEDEEEKRSGSGIGSIKRENTAHADTKPVKTERRSIANPSAAPRQPPAPMATPGMMKTEPGLAIIPFNQNVQQSSALQTTSPRVKQERTQTATTNTTAAIPEPSPFGVVSTTPTTSSASSTPYIDGHHRMQMRLMTPCSDSDGVGMQGFLPHSPGPSASDLLHTQHQHQPHQHTVGAGSPPLSTAAPSPYDFSQCLDVAGSPSPWHSQHSHAHHHHHPAHGLPHNPAYTTAGAGFAIGAGVGGYALEDAGYNNNNPFCNEHHHHHHDHDHGAHHHIIADPLGLHSGTGGTSLFRERELELQMDRMANNTLGGGPMAKHEWEEGFDGI
ncbi:uncharacterized protein B0T15DRAFT_494864 [Chaetomium strumarium]|uniref:Myb-like DNA-binding domain-containing protein n=1 Tax=Chaetomium strumarium TaxID=1170767 RepID=A0AAJ0GQV2_9PEZI|nr:hypothetical protein B0T15DRAFT_494864 [Chaetomium strumarium]